ncbi:peroxin-11 Pex11-Penicillium chrysogenum [Penicillium mononematosum]|uniref:Peroxin-11 Pex11-Penicillium chrysogenum n=2 Tax=Penicillium chrysogenum species complex TaxID=254878 RepID=B6GZG8_PENRW|nr:peroxin-11 Pex11-Penicillium chrysogenum [Penicillium rubens]XP_057151392.1 peroxin-11 Pex11-Penicillium chrysogenum [Penicillium mononematosum]AAQ08763.1 peroxin-11 [Penicillium chrysogenum]CAP80567.1 peroxin-11 Pex11-Penicillium chrysogenum [Penicillium rubens Wisconsin 54-1255]AAV53937.1 peroxin-11 [Penicillium chrysogenum]KAF3029114.1 Peroxisomal membrane protein PMP27 [Penicillium rubens]KAJ5034406.1 Peroxisomal membrane protein PMP27 [Penicillium rubens]
MVANTLVYHPALAHWLRFVATTVGRDKLLRTIQYFSRFYAWYLYRTNKPQSAIDPYNAVKKQFGTTRKIMRIGKFLEHLKAAAVAFDNKSPVDPVLRYLAIGRQLGYAGYLTLDAVTVIDVIGIRKLSSAKRLQDSAYRSWAAGLIFSTVAGIYTLVRLQEKEKTIDRKEGEGVVEAKKIEKERSAARIQLISDVCDLAAPLSAVGILNLDDGIVGITGTISSLIGVWSQWRKTAGPA